MGKQKQIGGTTFLEKVLYGLGDVGVHARGDAVLYVVGEGVGRHRDDGDGLAERVSAAADGLRRLVAVHVRHLNVHQDGVVFAGLDLSLIHI